MLNTIKVFFIFFLVASSIYLIAYLVSSGIEYIVDLPFILWNQYPKLFCIIMLLFVNVMVIQILRHRHQKYTSAHNNAPLGFKEMPAMRPIPIHTKEQPAWIRMWRWLTAIREWEVSENWIYELPQNGQSQPKIIIIPKGFTFDGASVPRIFWALLSPTGLLLIPGLVHDFAYKYNCLLSVSGEKYTVKELFHNSSMSERHLWDRLFLDISTAVSSSYMLSKIIYGVLYYFGFLAWNAHRMEDNNSDKDTNLEMLLQYVKVS